MKFIKQNYVQNVVITIGERMTCWAPLLKIPPALGMIGDNVNLIDGLMGDDRNPYFVGIIFLFCFYGRLLNEHYWASEQMFTCIIESPKSPTIIKFWIHAKFI